MQVSSFRRCGRILFVEKCEEYDLTMQLSVQEQQRQELGEQIYPLVEKLAGPEAGLVTGMILTLDIDVVEQAVQEPEVRHHVAF